MLDGDGAEAGPQKLDALLEGRVPPEREGPQTWEEIVPVGAAEPPDESFSRRSSSWKVCGSVSRRDYVAVAAILREANVSDEQRLELVRLFADLFARDNPRFRRDLFLNATQ